MRRDGGGEAERLLFSQAAEVGSRRVVAALALAQHQEDGKVDGRDEGHGGQGCDEA